MPCEDLGCEKSCGIRHGHMVCQCEENEVLSSDGKSCRSKRQTLGKSVRNSKFLFSTPTLFANFF